MFILSNFISGTSLANPAREENAELRPREPESVANNGEGQEEEAATPEDDAEGNQVDGTNQAPQVGETQCAGCKFIGTGYPWCDMEDFSWQLGAGALSIYFLDFLVNHQGDFCTLEKAHCVKDSWEGLVSLCFASGVGVRLRFFGSSPWFLILHLKHLAGQARPKSRGKVGCCLCVHSCS